MSVEARQVKCGDCGYEWESTAENPRCSKPTCGRSRDVHPVDPDDSDDGDTDPMNESDPPDPPDDGDDDQEADDGDGDDDGYTPAFATETVEADTEPDPPDHDQEADDGDQLGEQREVGEITQDDADAEDAQPKSEVVPEIDTDRLEPAIDTTFKIVSKRRGQHWELDDDEPEMLAEAWVPVLNHYAPEMVKEHTLIGVALLTTYAIAGPRLAEDRERQSRERAEQVDTDAEGSVRQPRTESDLDLGADPTTNGSTEQEQETTDADAENTDEIGGYASV